MHVYPDGNRRPIAYASRTPNEHDKRYGEIHKETSAIMSGPKRLHLYLYGCHFTIFSDHKPLEQVFGPKTAIPSLAARRLQRWAITLSVFNYSIKFFLSKQNAVCDASRLPLPSTLNEEDATYRRTPGSLVTHYAQGDKLRHTGWHSTIQSTRVCQTGMVTTCGRSAPTTLFQPPIWVIGRARLSSVWGNE